MSPRAVIGGNLCFRRRIRIHDDDARSLLLLLLLRSSFWKMEEGILRSRLRFPAFLGNRDRVTALVIRLRGHNWRVLGFRAIMNLVMWKWWVKRYDNVLALVIGTWWIDIDGDKQHFVSGTEKKFRICLISHHILRRERRCGWLRVSWKCLIRYNGFRNFREFIFPGHELNFASCHCTEIRNLRIFHCHV